MKDLVLGLGALFGVLAFAVLMIFVGPWLTIFMLNKLFGLALAVDLPTWCAAFWFNWLAFGGARKVAKAETKTA